jgi:hypothetical protein
MMWPLEIREKLRTNYSAEIELLNVKVKTLVYI